jgi:hypothetical protein
MYKYFLIDKKEFEKVKNMKNYLQKYEPVECRSSSEDVESIRSRYFNGKNHGKVVIVDER